jgi:hypothetical protein
MKMKFYFSSLLIVAGLAMAAAAHASVFSGSLTSGLSTGPQGVVTSQPVATPGAGTYTSSQSVVLSGDDATISIHYTTDGVTVPTCSSGTTYVSAISVAASETIQAISCYADNASSTVANLVYVISSGTSGGGGGGGGGSSGGGGGGSGGITNYTVTVTKNGNGSGSITGNGSNCDTSCSFSAGTAVTLTATSTPGSSFDGWTGPCSGLSATCSFVLNSNENVGTTFIQGQVAGATTINSHPDGTLVIDGSTVYLIAGGQLHGFRDPQEFASYGYKFNQTVPISVADKLLPTGDIMKAMTGTLALDTSDSRTIYMVGINYTKRGFVSMAVYRGLGYVTGSSTSNQPVHGVFRINMTDYPAGAPIASSTAAHPEGALVLDNTGTVWWILNGQRDGFESITVFNTYGFTFDRVVPANASDMALPVGPLVKLRDGTLVSQGGVTYIISDGQKLQFASGQALTSRGYNAANVVPDDVSGYTAGATLP